MKQRKHDLDFQFAFTDIQEGLHDQEFELEAGSGFAPIFTYRYVLCYSNPRNSAVLFIMETDAIVYSECLKEYLEKEFLPSGTGD